MVSESKEVPMVIVAKFEGRCNRCGEWYEAGERITWDPEAHVKGGSHLKCPSKLDLRHREEVRETMPLPASMLQKERSNVGGTLPLPWPQADTREVRMLYAGRLTCVLQVQDQRHMTMQLLCVKHSGAGFEACDLPSARYIFVEVKKQRVATLYIDEKHVLTYNATESGYIVMGALSVLFQYLHDGVVPPGFGVKSLDLCGKCGEPLMDAESKRIGLGPNCRPKAAKPPPTRTAAQLAIDELFDD